jgi:uncharacterized radical SAM superfamily Fe-S cluster-containing enzyme
MNKTLLAQLESMLSDAKSKRTWGSIEIEVKDGRPTIVRQTIQSKVTDEEFPNVSTNLK